MKISEAIKGLSEIQKEQGDIECELQDAPGGGQLVTSYELFYIVPEQYEDGWRVNIRTWPY